MVLHLRVAMIAARRDDLKALYLLRENIRYLLDKRHESQTALAQFCGHQKAWINKFLNDRNIINGREVSIADMDKIAQFFGLAVYQLFQPGISALGERRSASDRRSGQDRRIGHTGRHLAWLADEHSKLGGARGGGAALRPSADDPAIQRLVADFERRITAAFAQAGRQTPDPRGEVAATPQRRRGGRRSLPPTA